MKVFSLTLPMAAMMVASCTAFGVSAAHQHRQQAQPTQTFTQKLNDVDEMCIENVAELCLQADAALATECDLEEYAALVNQLQDQKEMLEAHVDRIDNLLHRLKGDGLEKPVPEDTYVPG